MNNELLPCPFCGDDEIMDFQAHLENRVQCAMCNVSTDTFPSCEESHAAWNTRTKAAPTEPQSDGVIVPSDDELMQMAFESGDPCENGTGYAFSMEQWEDFTNRLRAMLGGDHE